ncbi:pumilio-family RNA binding repeat containing protein [Aphelenchoides avenae]|nr:pumilio-family RNA binding repeat containing protein [Aphelenchus avenae]
MISNPGSIVVQLLVDKFAVDVFAPFVEVLLTPHVLCAVATSQYGSRVVMKLLSRLVPVAHSSVEVADDNRLTSRLLDELVDKAAVLVAHEFGNYVFSHMLKMKGLEHRRDHIINNAIRGRMLSLSQEKCASHAVEEALDAASGSIVRVLVDEVLHGYETDIKGRDAFDILLYDQYGNYVVQKMLNIAIDVLSGKREGDTQWFFSMRRKILLAAPRLENYSSGKKILRLLAPYNLLTLPA